MLFKFDENELFNKFNHLINLIKVIIKNWKNGFKVDYRWWKIFKTLEKNNISIKHFRTILKYLMTIPGTNASVEKIFSITSVL